MNNWTISRRIIAGFMTLLLISAVLGVFALWRLTGLAQNIAVIADNSLPSVVALGEIANLSRDNLISLLQIGGEGSAERNTQLEQKIAANSARRDELIKTYEGGLIGDDEDRRLFEESNRALETMTTSRNRALDLLRENKAEESRKLQQEVVIPDYEKYLKALDANVEYNNKSGKAAADAGKSSALFSVRLIGIALGLSFLLAGLLALMVIRSTNREIRDQAATQFARFKSAMAVTYADMRARRFRIGYDPEQTDFLPSEDAAPDICAARLELHGPYLTVEDNGGCGGVNVSFTGLYVRAGPHKG